MSSGSDLNGVSLARFTRGMTILDCLSENGSPNWHLSIIIIGVIFGLDFLLSAGATIMYFRQVISQRRIAIVSQVFLLLALLTKAITFLFSAQIKSVAEGWESFYGLILFETPCYIITTCYSLTLISWLSVFMEYLPDRYKKFASRAFRTVVGLNIAIYMLFIVDLFFEALNVGSDVFQTWFSTSVIALRDMAMGLAFVVFLKCGFGISDFSSASSQEKYLFRLNGTFAIVLIVRAAVVIAQEMIVVNRANECSSTFYTVFMINEIVLDYLPLSLLAFLTYSHIINKSSLQIVQITDATIIDSRESLNVDVLLSTE